MRGGLCRHDQGRERAGNIPAYAELMNIQTAMPMCPGENPRICGADCARFGKSSLKAGRSPHMQGGTCASHRSLRPVWEHLSICGADLMGRLLHASSVGIPPHMRGALCNAAQPAIGAGNIPACAGRTTVNDLAKRQVGEHPRMCGADSGMQRIDQERLPS